MEYQSTDSKVASPTNEFVRGMEQWIANVRGNGGIALQIVQNELPEFPTETLASNEFRLDVIEIEKVVPPESFSPEEHAKFEAQCRKENGLSEEIPLEIAESKLGMRLLVNCWAEDYQLCFVMASTRFTLDMAFPDDPSLIEKHIAAWEEFKQEINARNERLGIGQFAPEGNPSPSLVLEQAYIPKAPRTKKLQADIFSIHTSQEVAALEQSMANGKGGVGWENSDERRLYTPRNLPHRVVLQPEEDFGIAQMEQLTTQQDADSALALQYVLTLLAINQSEIDQQNSNVGAPSAVVDLNDICKKINPTYSRSPESDRLQTQAQVWAMLKFGRQAEVHGQRSTTYKNDKKETIPTRIDVPLWSFGAIERPIQPCFWQDIEIPVRVELLMSNQWKPLLTDPRLHQFIPGAEIIGQIPGGKPAGAIARVIALQLARLFRLGVEKVATNGTKVTRRELITKYPPKDYNFIEALYDDKNPARPVKYWHDSIQILVTNRFIAPTQEVKNTVDTSVRGWQEKWLDSTIIFTPGEKMMPCLLEIKRPPEITQPKRKPGRPPKKIAN